MRSLRIIIMLHIPVQYLTGLPSWSNVDMHFSHVTVFVAIVDDLAHQLAVPFQDKLEVVVQVGMVKWLSSCSDIRQHTVQGIHVATLVSGFSKQCSD